jgi:hypothetical protein
MKSPTKLKLSPPQADLIRAMQAGVRVYWMESPTKLKLSPPQADLIRAMQAGVRVYWMDGLSPYYFRTDTHAACTPQVWALLKKRLIYKVGSPFGKIKTLLTAKGRNWKP